MAYRSTLCIVRKYPVVDYLSDLLTAPQRLGATPRTKIISENGVSTSKNNKVKTLQPSQQTGTEFLLSIAGMFNSGISDSLENVDDDPWDEWFRLGEEISRNWQSNQTVLEILSEVRR